MGAWRAIRHRLEEAKPDGVVAPVRRPPVAREPERGLSDRAPARAGPDRPCGARAVGALGSRLVRPLELAAAARALELDQLRRGLRPVLSCELERELPLLRRQAAPDVVERDREADGAGAEASEASHAAMCSRGRLNVVLAVTAAVAVSVPAPVAAVVAGAPASSSSLGDIDRRPRRRRRRGDRMPRRPRAAVGPALAAAAAVELLQLAGAAQTAGAASRGAAAEARRRATRGGLGRCGLPGRLLATGCWTAERGSGAAASAGAAGARACASPGRRAAGAAAGAAGRAGRRGRADGAPARPCPATGRAGAPSSGTRTGRPDGPGGRHVLRRRGQVDSLELRHASQRAARTWPCSQALPRARSRRENGRCPSCFHPPLPTTSLE